MLNSNTQEDSKRGILNRKEGFLLKKEKGTQKNQTERRGHSKHKDTLFRLIFREKKDLLELYNAIRGTSYENPDDLEITTIQNLFYMKMKNDLSFLVDNVMNLYEHQSTLNPNMCLRGVEYFSRLYKRYLKEIGGNVYGSAKIPLPYPQYIVFYNGTKEQPERQVLRLSDSFVLPDSVEADEEPGLECRAVILNINLGRNKALMEKSRKLTEYAQFVECVRRTADGESVTEEVMEEAIEECIRQNILKDILESHREEVSSMFSDRAWDEHVRQEEERRRQEEERRRQEEERRKQEEEEFRKEQERERQEREKFRKEQEKFRKEIDRMEELRKEVGRLEELQEERERERRRAEAAEAELRELKKRML